MSTNDDQNKTTKATDATDEKIKEQDMKEFQPPPEEKKEKDGFFAWFWKAFGGNA